MPAPLVKSLAKKYHKSPKTVEKKWKKLKKGIVDSGKGGYGLVVSQLKKSLKKEGKMTPYKSLFESHNQFEDIKEQISLLELDRKNEVESLNNPKYKNKHEIRDRIDAIDQEIHRLENLL